MTFSPGTLKYGSLAGVKNIANPVSLARTVMEKTDHVMLIGQGANDFAREMGVAEVKPGELVTEEAKREWEDHAKFNRVVTDVFNSPKSEAGSSSHRPHQTTAVHPLGHDTVGAVALDLHGNIAAATSTGGISLKRVGRVGDTPLIGAGAYCDNDIGGVSCTGHGEAIARVVLAHRTLSSLQLTQDNSEVDSLTLSSTIDVIDKSLKFMLERTGGRGGLIMITNKGEIAKSFTTQRMCWASVNKNGLMECGI